MRFLGHVAALWRYPVKSMAGEPLCEASIEPLGMQGDRRFAIASTAAPHGKPLLSSRERTAMLGYAPRLEPVPEVRVPEGAYLPLPSPEFLAHLQTHAAVEGATLQWQSSPAIPFVDVRPLSLISVGTLRGLDAEFQQKIDPQRFRSNIILDLVDAGAFAEDTLCGTVLQIGEPDGAFLQILERIPRCRVVSLDPRTGTVASHILPRLAREHNGRVGIYARVLRPGKVRVGDPIGT